MSLSKVFSSEQAYVALSHVTSLSGLTVKDFKEPVKDFKECKSIRSNGQNAGIYTISLLRQQHTICFYHHIAHSKS